MRTAYCLQGRLIGARASNQTAFVWALCRHWPIISMPYRSTRKKQQLRSAPVSSPLPGRRSTPYRRAPPPGSAAASAMQFFGGSSLTSVAPESSPAPAAPPGTGTGSNAQVIYVFNRNGVCLLYREWHRPLRTLARNQDQKLMFGLLFSLRSFTAKIDPTSYVSSYHTISGS